MPAEKQTDDRSICTPCRGTGKLISGKGGEPHEISCPWCGGSGKFESGRDAQDYAPAAAPQAETQAETQA